MTVQRLTYGDESIEVVHSSEQHRHEIYQRNDGTLDFVGMFSHNLEVREAEEEAPDESLMKLRETYEMYNDQKAATTT